MPVDTDAGAEYYVKDLMHARRTVNELINEATMRFRDDYTEWRETGDPLRQLHKELQTAIMAYRSEVLTYADDIEGVWQSDIIETVDGETITLESLGQMEFGPTVFYERVSEIGRPATQDERVHYRYLSLRAAKAIRDQLNKAVRELGLIPKYEMEDKEASFDYSDMLDASSDQSETTIRGGE